MTTRFLYSLLLVLGLCCTSFGVEHATYLSTAEIDYNPKANRLEIALKIFPDDLSETLSYAAGRTIEIGTQQEHPEATEKIKAYLEQKFRFTVNNKPKAFRYLGREMVREDLFVLWVYLEIPKIRQLKQLSLHNSILTEYHEEQRNYVMFRASKEERYTRSIAVRGMEDLVLKE